MIYQLWDTESANLIAWFSSEEEALHEVRATFAEFGAAAALALALSSRDPSGHREAIAAGQALIDLAFGVRA
ncbi:MAG: hypothetical protein ACRDJE_05545 [Dehalococcoidia bacterium]